MSGLLAFNASVLGKGSSKPLAVALWQGKNIVGGLTGWTWMGWCYVELLWIEKRYQGKGYGTKLMRTAEAELRARGVRHMFLHTFSFQAPEFYKKLGFRQFGKLKGYPKGYDRFSFRKAL